MKSIRLSWFITPSTIDKTLRFLWEQEPTRRLVSPEMLVDRRIVRDVRGYNNSLDGGTLGFLRAAGVIRANSNTCSLTPIGKQIAKGMLTRRRRWRYLLLRNAAQRIPSVRMAALKILELEHFSKSQLYVEIQDRVTVNNALNFFKFTGAIKVLSSTISPTPLLSEALGPQARRKPNLTEFGEIIKQIYGFAIVQEKKKAGAWIDVSRYSNELASELRSRRYSDLSDRDIEKLVEQLYESRIDGVRWQPSSWSQRRSILISYVSK